MLAQRQQELTQAYGSPCSLRSAYDLAVVFGVDAYRDQDRDRLVGTSPDLLGVGAIHAGVGVRAGEWPGLLRLDRDERLLAEVGHGALGDAQAL